MKYFLFILSILFCLPSYLPKAYADKTYYAKVEEDNVYFYSSPSKSTQSTLFEIPNSYFVLLLGEQNEDFYYAKYKDVYGYVLKNSVSVLDGTPLNPFANITFRVFATQGLGLYFSPYQNENNLVSTVPFLTNNIACYGKIIGEQLIPDKSNEWFYCNYQADENYYGYVYSVFCDKITDVEYNNERFSIIENPSFTDETIENTLSNTSMIFIVIGVSLPSLVVIYLLIKPTFIKEKSLTINHRPRKKRHADYYEFDESDLS